MPVAIRSLFASDLRLKGSNMSIAFTVAMLYTPEHKVSSIVAVIRDESSRFQEDRKLRARVAELEAQLAAPAPLP